MDRPVRVLFFDHTAELGGGEIALADLIRHLDRRRVEPTVMLGSAGPLQDRIRPYAPVQVLPLDSAIVRARKDALGLRSLSNLSTVLKTAAYLFRLRRFIRKLQPDLVHTNSLKSAILGGFAARMAATPVVWHIRDRIAEDYLPPQAVRVVRALARILPTVVVANSEATLRTLHLTNTPSAVVPSGVDLSKFSATAASNCSPDNDPDKPIIGLVGRICAWKGQHVFVEAAAVVHGRYPAARFQIIGSALFSDQPYEQQIRHMIEERGLGEVIELTGFRADVERCIQSLDIVVHASVLGEPFGQVIVQGMACKKPVIATNGGGVPEIVVDGETGLLIPMEDAAAMADAVCHLIADREGARKMGENGYRRVLERFTVSATAEKLTSIYEKLAGKPSEGPVISAQTGPAEVKDTHQTAARP
jgi:glycosyltransferase involved in cell wall biosynthesis